MSHIRGNDTRHEEIVIKYLFSKGPLQTGSRSSEIPYSDFRARLLLAPSSGMQICDYTVHKL